jgi:LacI family transcriptional regulator
MTQHSDNKVITQEDVARQAGVSRSIVSYVINNGPRKVSDETRYRVLSAIKELGYRPNKHAQMLSSTNDMVTGKYIGIILAGNYMFKRSHYGSILASIHERAHERDWHIRFIRIFDDFSNPALFNELIHPNEIRGVILVGLDQVLKTPHHNELMQAIVERVARVVCIEWEWPGIPSIQFDRQKAAYQAAHHLLASGLQRIAYIGPDDNRIGGYYQGLWERNISPDRDIIYTATDTQGGYEQCKRLLHSSIPQGILAGTDEVAIGVLKCLDEHKLAVPGDVAVASIDNIDISAFTIPALTTVDVPKYQIGRHAIDLLVSDEYWKTASPVALTVPTQLIVRESSMPNASQIK